MAKPGDMTYREKWWKQIIADPEVVGSVLASALAISTEARRDGTQALMSNQRLAEILRKDERMVSRYTRQLRDLGYLKLVERGHRRGDGTLAANVYELFLPDTQMSSRDESQQDTQMSSRDSVEQQHTEFSTGQNGASTGQNGASTGHPDVYPLLNPSSFPNGMECTDANASDADALKPNGNNKQPFTDWRAEDEDLFRELMEVEHVTQRGQRYTIDGLYEAMRKKAHWPGRYFQEIANRSEAAIDEYLLTHFGIDRWAE
jgi:hypothetical protein